MRPSPANKTKAGEFVLCSFIGVHRSVLLNGTFILLVEQERAAAQGVIKPSEPGKAESPRLLR